MVEIAPQIRRNQNLGRGLLCDEKHLTLPTPVTEATKDELGERLGALIGEPLSRSRRQTSPYNAAFTQEVHGVRLIRQAVAIEADEIEAGVPLP